MERSPTSLALREMWVRAKGSSHPTPPGAPGLWSSQNSHCWWERSTGQPLWKQPGSFWHLNGSLTIWANNSTLAYLCKRKPCIQLLVEAIFIIIKNHKQPRYPSTGEQTGISMQRNKKNESWYRPQRGKFPNALMLMKVVRPKRLQTVWFYLYDLLEKIKL